MYDLTPRPLNSAGPAPSFDWPNNTKSALFLGIDVDAETAWLAKDPSNVNRLVTVSHGGYGPRVGVPKILELLCDLEIKATFFCPGWVVRAYPKMHETILNQGHEIAHHGYLHKLPDPDHPEEAMEEIDKGFEAMQDVLGFRPIGFRAAGGENFASMLKYLSDLGIKYSSSWRDDIRPYRHCLYDGTAGPVEIPVNFTFDDWLYGLSARLNRHTMFGKDAVLPLWKDEFDATHAWRGVTTIVCHPQVSGRPMRWHLLRDFLEYAQTHDDVWFATGREIAEHYEKNEALTV
jgi:peptidoglycan/xylan/chitin deacetylase (PgdA/CDA1 family)